MSFESNMVKKALDSIIIHFLFFVGHKPSGICSTYCKCFEEKINVLILSR